MKEATGHKPAAEHPCENSSPMSGFISTLLIAGVLVAAAVLFAGLVLLLATGRTGYAQPLGIALLSSSPEAPAFPHTVAEVLSGIGQGRPFAIIELGALLLLATPVLRVAASIFLFMMERDRFYTGLTALVLLLLVVSIFWVA